VTPESADGLGAFQIREAKDVEEFGSSGRREGEEPPSILLIQLLEFHEWTVVPPGDSGRKTRRMLLLCPRSGRTLGPQSKRGPMDHPGREAKSLRAALRLSYEPDLEG
jgi:hypothetical protein